MAARPTAYGVLTEEQKHALTCFYDEGMTSAGVDKRDMITKAADETGTSFEKVKKWIGNERRKRKLASLESTDEGNMSEQSGTETVGKYPPAKRMTSGYNMFFAKMMSSDICKDITSKSEKLSYIASKWKSLSAAEHDLWKKEATKVGKLDVKNLSEEQRKKCITKSKKNLIAELSHLENLGCEVAVVMLEPQVGAINQYGSEKGVQFLQQNEAIPLKFMEFFDCPKINKNSYTIFNVQDLFNKKYSEACGKPGSRVPYIKGGFVVTGMPEGIPFKKPSCYGLKQVCKILNNHESITFQLTDETIPTHAGDGSEEAAAVNLSEVSSALHKIVDGDKVAAFMGGRALIEESDMEVTDVELSEDEFQLLVTKCNQYFSDDALTSLQANYESCCNHEGYILPIYTEAEPYWLLYYPGKKSELLNLEPDSKICGYWLDKTQEHLKYRVLPKKTTIEAISMIRRDEAHLLALRRTIELKKSYVSITDLFHDTVISYLKKYGFV